MNPSSPQYYPLSNPLMLLLGLAFVVLVALVELGLLRYAYERMGIPPRYVMAVLLLSLLGSAINIPIAQLPPEPMVTGGVVNFFGMGYVVPVVREWPGTVIAINVGGALIPFIVSVYLTIRNRLFWRAPIAVAIVAVVVHGMAVPVRGVGISVPVFVPPIVAAVVGLLLGWRRAAPLAYIAGSLGTLIGADLTNLGRVQGLGAPVASIGGAGTFDGVFLTGILAVLLTPVAAPRRAAWE